jgi:hypothetical protein
MSGVFGKANLAIHAVGYLLVVDLLLDVELRQFGGTTHRRIFSLAQHSAISIMS